MLLLSPFAVAQCIALQLGYTGSRYIACRLLQLGRFGETCTPEEPCMGAITGLCVSKAYYLCAAFSARPCSSMRHRTCGNVYARFAMRYITERIVLQVHPPIDMATQASTLSACPCLPWSHCPRPTCQAHVSSRRPV